MVEDTFAVKLEPLISALFALQDTGALNKPLCASALIMRFHLLGRTRPKTALYALPGGTRTVSCLVADVWLVTPVRIPPPRAFAVQEPTRRPLPLLVLRAQQEAIRRLMLRLPVLPVPSIHYLLSERRSRLSVCAMMDITSRG